MLMCPGGGADVVGAGAGAGGTGVDAAKLKTEHSNTQFANDWHFQLAKFLKSKMTNTSTC